MRYLSLILALVLSVVIFPAVAQDIDACSPAGLEATVAERYEAFTESASELDEEEYLAQLTVLRDTLTELIDGCANQPQSGRVSASEPGSGSFADPFRFGIVGDLDRNMSLKISGVLRPADTIIRSYNMFNDRPGTGQEYMIVKVEVNCLDNARESCETSYFDFQLVGEKGTVYDYTFVVNDNEFDVELFPGGSASGDLVFLIDSTDTELKLIYQELFGIGSDRVFFEAEPSRDSGLTVVAVSNVNIRSAPTTSAGVVGSLQPSVEVLAFGRNGDGTWVQTAVGWVFAELVTVEGNIQDLPITSD